jgi:hypothetical protein
MNIAYSTILAVGFVLLGAACSSTQPASSDDSQASQEGALRVAPVACTSTRHCPSGQLCVDDLAADCFHTDDGDCPGQCIDPDTARKCRLEGPFDCGRGKECTVDPRDRTADCRESQYCDGFCVAKTPAAPPSDDNESARPLAGRNQQCGGKRGIRCQSGLHCVKPSCPDCTGHCKDD